MSIDTIAVIISGATLLVSFAAAFGWMIHHVDARLDRSEARMDARIDGVERTLGARIDGVERELVEVKIALARIEGPPRRLISTR